MRSHSIVSAPITAGDERGQDGRDAEQVAERDAGECDVPEAVADQRCLPLDEEEADGRREQADDRARRKRKPHELEVKHVVPVVVLVGRVVPHAGEPARRPVVDDAAADEHDPVDDVLDGAELVGDVEDRDAEIRAQRLEQEAERLLRRGVDARRRLVEREQRGLGGERLGDQRPLLHPAGERPQRRIRPILEPDGLDRARDGIAVGAPQRPPDARRGEPPGGDDLPHRHRRLAEEPRPLWQVADAAAAATLAGRLAEHAHRARARALEPEHEPEQRRLAAAVRAGDRNELARRDRERDILEHADAGPVAERDAVELDDGAAQLVHPSAFRRVARFARMTEK